VLAAMLCDAESGAIIARRAMGAFFLPSEILNSARQKMDFVRVMQETKDMDKERNLQIGMCCRNSKRLSSTPRASCKDHHVGERQGRRKTGKSFADSASFPSMQQDHGA